MDNKTKGYINDSFIFFVGPPWLQHVLYWSIVSDHRNNHTIDHATYCTKHVAFH